MEARAAEDARILVVDDDEGLAALFEAVLEDAGYPVTTANSGMEAVRCVNEQEPSVILLDIRMPGMDGIETFRELRRRVPQSQIIFMTGYAEPPLARTRWRGGAVEQLPEPHHLEHLINQIVEVAEDRGALLVAQGVVGSQEIAEALISQSTTPRVVHNAHEAIFHFEGIPRQVVILEEKLVDLPPLMIRDLNPGVVRLLLSHSAPSAPGHRSLPPTPFLAKPFRPDELLQTVEMAVSQT
jgi:CheY-like chemotaxis protein